MPLRDILYQLSLAKEVPDAELLDEFVRRHPEHAQALTEFATELVVERRYREKRAVTLSDPAVVSPPVSRAMSKFQNAIFANRAGNSAAVLKVEIVGGAVVNPFVSLDRRAFRELARELNVTTLFLGKVRDRLIEYATLTPGFVRRFADKLRCLPDVIAQHLAADPEPVFQGQFAKAEDKPVIGRRQSFEEAVKSSGLSDEQQRELLSL
ncbi:MAG: hypothetical protein ACRC7O_18710 [Fimbriiglobus sp.]